MSADGIPLSDIRHSTSARFMHEDPQTPSRLEPLGNFARSLSYQSTEDSSSIRPLWRRQLFELLESPASSQAAFVIHFFITGLIILSAIVTVLETMPSFKSQASNTFFFGFETSLVALFTVEYVARCVAWSSSLRTLFRWIGSFNGICDLLAIVPYYVEIALQQDTSVFFRFSILRVFRLLRVFRPFRTNNTVILTIEVMYLSLHRSQHALLALSFFILMVLTVFSTLLYFVERGTWDETLGFFINSDGDPSQFSSIPAAAWFVLVTITTVGYGEIVPRSFLGRVITLPLLLSGLLLIALPSFVLGREFSLAWAELSEAHGGDGEAAAASAYDMHRADGDPFLPAPARRQDLSNRKLARNQTELSRQIVELRGMVAEQNELIRRLLAGRTASPGA